MATEAFSGRGHVHERVLRDGGRIAIRPLLQSDRAELLAGFERLSPESRYRRFFVGMASLSPQLVEYLTELDYVDHYACAAFILDGREHPGAGVARYIRDEDDPGVAEAAVAVVDDEQGRGIGRALLEELATAARENGVETFVGRVQADNAAVVAMLEKAGATTSKEEPGVIRFRVPLPADPCDPKGRIYDVLRNLARQAP